MRDFLGVVLIKSLKSIQYGNISAYNTWANYWIYRNKSPPQIHLFIFTLLFSPTHFHPTIFTHLFHPKKWVKWNTHATSEFNSHLHALVDNNGMFTHIGLWVKTRRVFLLMKVALNPPTVRIWQIHPYDGCICQICSLSEFDRWQNVQRVFLLMM